LSSNSAKLEIKSLTDNIGLARVTVASFAAQLDFTLSEIEEVKVAVSEAVSNAIIHAYHNNEGVIEIGMAIDNHRLIVTIKDYGQGISDIEQARQPSYTTADRMGLGLVFIDSFMNDLEVDSKLQEGTKLKMIKIPEKSQKKAT